MVQHLLLMMVAPALIFYGQPVFYHAARHAQEIRRDGSRAFPPHGVFFVRIGAALVSAAVCLGALLT